MKTTALATGYGPGDCATWQSCVGHPSDPRTEHNEDAESYLTLVIELRPLLSELEDAAERGNEVRCVHIVEQIRSWLK